MYFMLQQKLNFPRKFVTDREIPKSANYSKVDFLTAQRPKSGQALICTNERMEGGAYLPNLTELCWAKLMQRLIDNACR